MDNEKKEKLRRALDIAPIGTLHERIDSVEKRFGEQLERLRKDIHAVSSRESRTRAIAKITARKLELNKDG